MGSLLFRRRPKPFKASWDESLRSSIRQWAWLSNEDQSAVRRFVTHWLAHKRFEGCGGMKVTEEVALSIAGQAAIAAIGLEGEFFDRIRSVLVYPGDYKAPRSTPLDGGSELLFREHRLGELSTDGCVVFSWRRVVEGGRMRDGPRSVVVHELAHAFDLLDGAVDGIPPLPGTIDARCWRERFGASYESFLDRFPSTRRQVQGMTEDVKKRSRRSRMTLLDDYARESEAEYFAVASEAFFQDPVRLARSDEQLYELLQQAWRQDPIRRVR